MEHIKLRSWVGQVFYSFFNSHSRGVAILIHKKLPFTLEELIKDDEGRFVIISGFLYGDWVLIGSLYGPNTFEPSFFSKLLAAASSKLAPFTVLGGDCNCVQDTRVDQSPPKPAVMSKKTTRLKELCVYLGLWCLENYEPNSNRLHILFSSSPIFFQNRLFFWYPKRQWIESKNVQLEYIRCLITARYQLQYPLLIPIPPHATGGSTLRF